MATKIGPKTVTQRDRSKNLVFCIDAAHSDSYGGEPTTNLADNDTKRTMTTHDDSTCAFADAPEKGSGWKKITITARGSNDRVSQFPYISQASKTYTYSVEYDFGELTGYYWKVDGHSGMTMRLTQGQRGKTVETYTNGSTESEAIFLAHNTNSVSGLNDVIYYRYYQVEEKSHATPFTEGSRTASNAITNISGVGAQGTTLTGTFATYGQELMQAINHSGPGRKVLKTIENDKGHVGGAYWDLDGSDEYIVIPYTDSSELNLTRGTIITWFKASGGGHNGTIVGWGTTATNNFGNIAITSSWTGSYADESFVYARYRGSAASISMYVRKGANFYADSTWHCVAVTSHGGASDLGNVYIDGELQTVSTTSNIADAHPFMNVQDSTTKYLNIGRRPYNSGTTYFNGEVANTMIWGSSLTAKEIKDIYIAQKGRFGK